MDFSSFPEHHALLVTHPDRQMYGDSLWKELSSLSPAHRYFNQTVLDIDTARSIIAWAQSSYQGERVALISFHTASLPAQNAMLKVLEEPRDGTRFILVTTNKTHLIDTVLSRVLHIDNGQGTGDDGPTYAEEFLRTAQQERMKSPFIIEMLARTDEEGRKDRESVKSFILSLVSPLTEKKTNPRYITETLEIASYASDPSASGKALLEYLALLLPVIK
ncbi:MAG: hypothetical protein RIQ41_530, partial [Candidatus Parcubacteria bacterium]